MLNFLSCFHGSSSKTGRPSTQSKPDKTVDPIFEVLCKSTPTLLQSAVDEFVRAPKGSEAAVQAADKIELTLTHGSDPNLTDDRPRPWFSYLSKAIIHDRPWLFQKLLSHPKIKVNRTVGIESPLDCAIQKGNSEAVNALLKKNADVSMRPIVLAVLSGQPEMVRPLLDKLPTDAASPEDNMLEGIAKRQQQKIEAWRHISAEDKKDRLGFVLNEDIRMSERLLKVRTILLAGADPNTRLHDGSRPLHNAIAANHTNNAELLQLLLVMGADPNGKNDRGDTPLLTAAKENKLPALKTLLRAGADPNLVNDEGIPPLAWADYHHNEESIEALREAGADPNLANNKRVTLLAWAT